MQNQYLAGAFSTALAIKVAFWKKGNRIHPQCLIQALLTQNLQSNILGVAQKCTFCNFRRVFTNPEVERENTNKTNRIPVEMTKTKKMFCAWKGRLPPFWNWTQSNKIKFWFLLLGQGTWFGWETILGLPKTLPNLGRKKNFLSWTSDLNRVSSPQSFSWPGKTRDPQEQTRRPKCAPQVPPNNRVRFIFPG